MMPWRALLGMACIVVPWVAHGETTNDAFSALEKSLDARIGVVAVDTHSGQRVAYREHERFLMCSTFKLLLAAHILHRVDLQQESLARMVRYSAADLLSYAPITAPHVATGMSVGDLCAAALQYSDNTAANVLLRTQGGPAGLTDYVKSLGDPVTRLDRVEPDLNTPAPEKDFDTTTPHAMAETVRKFVLGTALSPSSRERLETWLLGNTTGATRLRAGLPAAWRIGDKTGTGDNGITNDVAIVYRPGKAPLAIAAFVGDCKGPKAACDSALARIARIIVGVMNDQNSDRIVHDVR